MRAIAYTGTGGRLIELAHLFASGCGVHEVDCAIKPIEHFKTVEPCDVVWMYALAAHDPVFHAYRGHARRVVGDLGYWREEAYKLPLELRHVRIAVEALQPDLYMASRPHPSDRFDALGLAVEPVRERGAYILVCGHSEEQAARHGFHYGQWEAQVVGRLTAITKRDLQLREKPGLPRIKIEGVAQSVGNLAAAIRGAWAVVCLSGNIGADAILHGVPVVARSGPGAAYHRTPLESIEQCAPLAAGERLQALADIAYCQWTPEEFASGSLWKYLRDDGLLP